MDTHRNSKQTQLTGGSKLIDKDTFCEQTLLCEQAMYRLAFSVVKNDSDAAEVISEAVFRAYKNLSSLKDTAAFKAWMLKIVHNTAVEFIRKNSKTVFFEEPANISANGNTDPLTAITLKDAVKKLPQQYRTAVILYYYEDLPISQIAKITNTSAVTVKQRLSRARKQLKIILKEDYENE